MNKATSLQMERRAFLTLLGAAGATFALSSCVAGPPAAVKSGSTLVAAPPDVAEGTVTYWEHFASPAERLGFDTVTTGFQSTFPNVDLAMETLPYGDFMTKFTTAVQSGGLPDAVMVASSSVPDMISMNGLLDISGAVDAWDGAADIEPRLFDVFRRSGGLYGIPAILYVDWIYYRMDWFEEAGIDGPPRTWDDFRSTAKKLTDPALGRYGYGMRGGAGGSDPLYKLIAGFNGPIVDGSGAPALTSSPLEEALAQFTDLYLVDKSVPPSAPADGRQQMIQGFLTGQTGMLMHATGSLQEIVAGLEPGVQVMTAPLPKAKFEMGQVQPLGNGLTSTNNPGAALAWLEYWGSAAAQLDFLAATGYLPASSGALADPQVTDNQMLDAARKQIEIGVVPPVFRGLGGWLSNSVEVQLQSVLIGQSTVKDAARVILNDFEALF